MPALIPDELQIFPSATQRARRIHVGSSRRAITSFQARLLLVARFPSSTPARAARPEPVHTVSKYLRDGYIFPINSITGLEEASLRVPPPPGTSNTSIFLGGLSNVCVGTTACPILDPAGFQTSCLSGNNGATSVDTGSRVAAIMDSSIFL